MTHCLTMDSRMKYNMCQGLIEFAEHIASSAQQWGQNFATAIRKTTVAEELGKDTRTVTRYLNQLSDMGFVETTAKRGRNGGTIVMFNTELFSFEPTDNPITSETKEADEIREKVFPRKPKKQPKKRYRSKAQIAEERALQLQKSNENSRLNDILETMPTVNRDFFENFDEPRLYFQGYLIAQMYNAYAVVFPKNRHEFYADIDPKKSEEGLKSMYKAHGYNVLPARFVGTPQYNKFVELAKYCNENEINPLSYLTVMFEYAEWLSGIGKARVGAIPYVNSLLSEDSKDRFLNQKSFYRRMRNSYGLFRLSNSTVPFIGAKYPIINSLHFAYKYDRTSKDALDPLIKELYEMTNFSTKATTLAGYYFSTLKDVCKSDLEEDEKQAICDFLKEQVALYSRNNSISPAQYALAFPLQIYTVRATVAEKGLDISDYHTYIGNMYKRTVATDEDMARFEEVGKCIDFSYNSNVTFSSTMRMLADCRGLGVAPNVVGNAINKYGADKIPLDTFGMLDIDRLYKELIPEEELEADMQRELEMINTFR